jgi:histidinol-phosphate/aromatic aminotransferase/cobyric acid decarboxylase-like protein
MLRSAYLIVLLLSVCAAAQEHPLAQVPLLLKDGDAAYLKGEYDTARETFSKAWGLAALRLGMAFASIEIINVLNKVKPPYNINDASQQLALEALQNTMLVNEWIEASVLQKKMLLNEMSNFSS